MEDLNSLGEIPSTIRGEQQAKVTEAQSLNVLKIVSLILKWKKLILLNFVVITSTVIVVSFLLPKWYKASTVVLPAENDDMLSNLAGGSMLMKSLTSLPIGKLGNKQSFDDLAILNSRSSMESLVSEFDLMNNYKIKNQSLETAVKELRANCEFTPKDDGSIIIDVWDKDPIRAADMANYFVQMLDQINVKMTGEHSRSNREFIGKRVDDTKANLKQAEEDLKHFQETNSSLIIPAEAQEALKAIAELYATRSKTEIAISVMERNVSGKSPQLEQMRIELEELNKKLAAVPQVGLNYLRAYRDVLIQQKIYEYLVPLYEQAKIEEQKDLPIVMVLDRAVPPEKADKPNKRLLVGLAGFISLLISFLIITWREYLSYLRTNRSTEWAAVRAALPWRISKVL